jgi:hypothetical protein
MYIHGLPYATLLFAIVPPLSVIRVLYNNIHNAYCYLELEVQMDSHKPKVLQQPTQTHLWIFKLSHHASTFTFITYRDVHCLSTSFSLRSPTTFEG